MVNKNRNKKGKQLAQSMDGTTPTATFSWTGYCDVSTQLTDTSAQGDNVEHSAIVKSATPTTALAEAEIRRIRLLATLGGTDNDSTLFEMEDFSQLSLTSDVGTTAAQAVTPPPAPCGLVAQKQLEIDELASQLDAHHTTVMDQMSSIEKKDAQIARLKGACGKKDGVIGTYKAEAVKLREEKNAAEKKLTRVKGEMKGKDEKIQKLELEVGGMKDKQQKKDDKKADYLEMKQKQQVLDEQWEKKHLGMHLE